MGVVVVGEEISVQRRIERDAIQLREGDVGGGLDLASCEQRASAKQSGSGDGLPRRRVPPAVAAAAAGTVKVPSSLKLMPHRHQEDQIYTVVSGLFYIGLGDQSDVDTVRDYPLGSVTVPPGNPSHFHWARFGGYVVQVTETPTLPVSSCKATAFRPASATRPTIFSASA